MKFSVNRRVMLEHLKTMIKVVPKDSPIKELNGFLIEANEDDGYLYMTANNLKVAVQRKFKPSVETGGNFVMDAKLLVDILALLGGDEVIFEEIKPGMITVKSGGCVYTLRVLSGQKYPRPEIPFLDKTVNICDIKRMYSRTYAAVGGDGMSEAFKGIHFDISPNCFKLESCNTREIAVSENKMTCGGCMEFILSKHTVSYLAAVAGNEEVEVGSNGPYIVFMKEGMLFSSKKIPVDFVDVNKILNSLQTVYTAAIRSEEFKEEILNTCDLASMGKETSYIKLEFNESSICLSTLNEVGNGENMIPCITVKSTFGLSNYYSASALKNALKTVEDRVMLRLDERGYMLIEDERNRFMITPIPDISVRNQFKKIGERKTEGKSGDTTKKKESQAA